MDDTLQITVSKNKLFFVIGADLNLKKLALEIFFFWFKIKRYRIDQPLSAQIAIYITAVREEIVHILC